MLETMELLADPGFIRQLARLKAGKLKFYPVSSLAGTSRRPRSKG